MSYFVTPVDAATPHAQLHMYRLLEHNLDGPSLYYTPRTATSASPWKVGNGSRPTRDQSSSQEHSLPYNSGRRRTNGSIISITRNTADNTFLSGKVATGNAEEEEENRGTNGVTTAPRLFDIVAEDQLMEERTSQSEPSDAVNGTMEKKPGNGVRAQNGATNMNRNNGRHYSASSTSPAESAERGEKSVQRTSKKDIWQAEAERLHELLQSCEQQISLVMEEGERSAAMSPMRTLAKLIRAMLRQREGGKRHKLERDEARARHALGEHLYHLQAIMLAMQEDHIHAAEAQQKAAAADIAQEAVSASAAESVYTARNRLFHEETEKRRKITYDEADAFFDLLRSADEAAMALVVYERRRLSSVALSRPTISPSTRRAWSQENSYMSKDHNNMHHEEGVLHDVHACSMTPE